MSSPISPSKPPSASFFDLVDLDFSEPPPNVTPLSPATQHKWSLMIPETKAVTPTTVPLEISLSDGEDEATEGDSTSTKEEIRSDDTQEEGKAPEVAVAGEENNPAEEGEDKPIQGEANTEEPVEVLEEPKVTAPAASESGDSANSASLRAAATPFTSKALRVAPASAPHSFFPDRADTTSHTTVSLPTSPYANTGQDVPSTTAFFYGESDGYAADGTVKVPTTWSHSPPTSALGLSPVAAASFRPPPETKPIRITSPPRVNKPLAKIPSPATPSNIPLPDSLPPSANARITPSPTSVNPSLDLLSDDHETHENDAPVNGLIRFMSNVSLGGTEAATERPPSRAAPEPAQSAESAAVPATAEVVPPVDEPMPSEEAQKTLAGLLESLEELDEMEKQWADYRDAYGKFSGGIEEVVARLRFNLDGHTCANSDQKDDLRAARQQILTLQNELRELKNARAAKDRSDRAKADTTAELEKQLSVQVDARKKLEKLAEEAKAVEGVALTKLEQLRERYDTLEADRVHWHKRESELGKSFIVLEDQYERTITELGRMKKRVAAMEEAQTNKVEVPVKATAVFGVALIEYTATAIDEDFVKRGAAGGKELGENILAAIMPKEEGLVIGQIFLNFPDLRKRLTQKNIIKKEADLHDFLDGFRSVSGLFTVVDTEAPPSKMQDHLKLYKLLGATKIIIISRRSSIYREVIEALPSGDRSEIFAVRGSDTSDPFDFLGASQLVSIPGLMDLGPSAARAPTPLTQTPATPASVPSTLEKPPQRSRTPPHLRSVSVSGSVTGPLSPSSEIHSIPPTPASDLPVAPWAQPAPKPAAAKSAAPKPRPPVKPPSPTVPRKPAAGVPWWEQGGTLNDQVRATPSVSERRLSTSTTDLTPPATPRAPTNDDPTPKRQRTTSAQGPSSRAGLAIPVNDLGSLAGSPPDSDEDHPNVELPHSAVKWVQRPIEFSQETASQAGRSRSNSISSSAAGGSRPAAPARAPNGYAARTLAQQGLGTRPRPSGSGPSGRAASTTGANTTPVATPSIHGFKVHPSRQGLIG